MIRGSMTVAGVMSGATLMYLSMSFPRMFSWLLAAAIAVQPVSGLSCDCRGASSDSGAQPVKQRRCCCGSARHGDLGSRPQRTCCQHRASRDDASSGACVCHGGSSAPAAPQSVPAQRSPTDDLAASVLCAHVVTAEAPTVHQQGWAIRLPTAFASASEHCIALCRLLF